MYKNEDNLKNSLSEKEKEETTKQVQQTQE